MRVVAFTLDTSLAVALSMMDDWEVVAADSVDQAVSLAPLASIVLIGMGNTDDGLRTAHEIYSRGVTSIPYVVVGDVPPPPGALAPVICRPFSLDDIRTAVEAAMGGAARDASVESVEEELAALAYEGEDLAEVKIIDLDAERVIRMADPVEPETEDDVDDDAIDTSGVPPAPEPTEPPASSRRQKEQPQSPRVKPSARSTRSGAPSPESAAPAQQAPAKPDPAPAPKPARAAERAKVRPEPVRDPAQPAPQAPAPAQEDQARKRFMRRKPARQVAASDESPLVAKMRRVAAAGKDLEELLAELPMLADLASMSEALLGEVVERFVPQVACVYVRSPKGFRLVAGHGLSKVERGLVVSVDHPLFGEMLRTPEAVLISPVDLAQGLVAGIAGARTEALLAAPVQVAGHCVAIIVVGRHAFSEADLDVLDALAVEAAPGLAVAQMLDRLRDL